LPYLKLCTVMLTRQYRNIVLLITSIFLLKSGQVETLNTSLIGSILTVNLLNTSTAFLAGGSEA
jgi:Ca2+/H+ antiporter